MTDEPLEVFCDAWIIAVHISIKKLAMFDDWTIKADVRSYCKIYEIMTCFAQFLLFIMRNWFW